MIDRPARDRYAEQLRHFAAGIMSVEEYERRTEALALDSDDPALPEIWHTVWCLYDDFRTERLQGEWALSRPMRRDVTRWLLFLYSDTEYRWQPQGGLNLVGCVLSLVTVGWWSRWTARRRDGQMSESGVIEFWPFQNSNELQLACENSRFCRPRAA